ncbi:rCG44093 [Rattus norvegicus]|uniref:RCG44093 n=1 Tax=Rattus norvegicus TaxID=10116 RepID=A6J6V3_RAT|nr:rCG44093 [Rattus norvegicus]
MPFKPLPLSVLKNSSIEISFVVLR